MAGANDKATDDTLAAGSGSSDSGGDATQAASISTPPRGRRPSIGDDYAELEEVDPKHYAIGQELARGGMGRIVRARDRRLGRSVAIKELLEGQDDVRFEREARITARLQHPSIVAVHEAGRWPSGEPFFAMKLVAGTPLDRKIAATKRLDERLGLVPNVIAAVDALAYAHCERVIHRDLKPSNVLCGEFGETVVIDWGLAKDLAEADDDVAIGPYRTSPVKEGETVVGAVMGTPAYMPPEQAVGERVDARADVYALGAMLYHVLAGVPPYEGRTTDDVLALVRKEPPRSLADREPDAPLELVAIVGVAMAREPDERFATAQEMATELRRFQMGKLVTSHRYTRWELVTRWIRRHRAPVIVGAVAFGTLAIVGTIGIVKIVTEGRRADREGVVAQTRLDAATFEQARVALDTDPSEALRLLAGLGHGAPEWGPARTIAEDAVARGIARVLKVEGVVEHLAFAGDGAQLVAAVRSGDKWALELWQVASWREQRVELGTTMQLAVGFASNGDVLHVAADGSIARFNAAANIDTTIRKRDGEYGRAAIAPTGQWLALFARDSSVLVAATGGERVLGNYSLGTWSPDGAVLVAYDRSNEGRVDRVDPTTLAATEVGRGINSISIATDGTRVWVGTYAGELVDIGSKTHRISGHRADPLTQLATLPDGAVVTVVSHHGFMSTRDDAEAFVGDYSVAVTAGAVSEVAWLRGHRADVTAIATTRDGRIASGDVDGTVRVWQRAIVKVRPPDGHTAQFAVLGRTPGEVVIAHRMPTLEVLDIMAAKSRSLVPVEPPPRTGIETHVTETIGDRRIIEVIDGPDEKIEVMLRARDGARVLTLDTAKHAVIWDLDRGGRQINAEDVHHIALSADGKHVATSNDEGVWLWDADTGRGKQLADSPASVLALSSDGARLALATLDGQVALFNTSGLEWVFAIDREMYDELSFSPDGRWLAAGGDSGKVRVFDCTLHGMRALGGHIGTVTGLVFDRDGTRLASTAMDRTVRVWTLAAADGAPRVLRGHTEAVTSILFDGDRLITASTDRTARVWDLTSGDSRTLGNHADSVIYANVAPSGQLVTIDHDDRHSVYPDDLPRDEQGLRQWLAQRIAGN